MFVDGSLWLLAQELGRAAPPPPLAMGEPERGMKSRIFLCRNSPSFQGDGQGNSPALVACWVWYVFIVWCLDHAPTDDILPFILVLIHYGLLSTLGKKR